MVKLAFNPDDVPLGVDTRNQPIYTAPEASGYLAIPKATISAWFFGTTYGPRGKKVDFEAVLTPANLKLRLLSFNNLVEAYILRRFRQQDEMRLRAISTAIKKANELGIARPLLEKNLLKGGKSLFLEQAGQVVGLSDPSQLLLPNARLFFERVEYRDDAITALFPFTRPDPKESPKIVSISPDFSFGRSIVDRTKVQTSIIAKRYLNGDSVTELAEDYRCEVMEVEESIRAEWMFARGQTKKAA